MSCTKMESRILAYVDGRLKESERADVEKHLTSCAVCRVRANEFRSVNELLGELPMIEPSPRIAFVASMLLLAIIWVGYRSQPVPTPLISPEEADASMMQDISVIEDHDTLANFEPLKALPAPVDTDFDDPDHQM